MEFLRSTGQTFGERHLGSFEPLLSHKSQRSILT
jgi:hypothetical protein